MKGKFVEINHVFNEYIYGKTKFLQTLKQLFFSILSAKAAWLIFLNHCF